ncbi:MAG: hypothetical protein RL557_500 [archaeon]|jgi:metal-sulfur cluster biosynthetic enzyme
MAHKKLTQEHAIESLKKVIDPELGIDIYTLGLIYGITISGKKVFIKMTFTSPLCPYGPVLVSDVKKNLVEHGFKEADVEVVFTPMWEPSKEVMMMLGLA